LYEVPAFVPLDKRGGMAPRQYEAMWEQASIVLRYGELDALRATRTLAAMQLLASRLDAYRAKHGKVTNDLAILRREPWPYNDWLETTDAWGMPLRIDVDGGSYRIRSAGSDPQFEQVIADGAIVKQFDRVAWTKRETERRVAADRAAMARRSGEATTAPDGSPAYRIGGDVKAPVKVSGPEPVYPASLLQQKIGGLIIVEMVVDEEGRVAAANVLHSPNPLLSDAAVAALEQWKFRPATLNGKPVKVILDYTVLMRPRT
jgi:TonB family protein